MGKKRSKKSNFDLKSFDQITVLYFIATRLGKEFFSTGLNPPVREQADRNGFVAVQPGV